MPLFGDKDKDKIKNSRESEQYVRPGSRPGETHSRPRPGANRPLTPVEAARKTENYAKPHLGNNRSNGNQNANKPVNAANNKPYDNNAGKNDKESSGVFESVINAIFGDDENGTQQKPNGYHGNGYGNYNHNSGNGYGNHEYHHEHHHGNGYGNNYGYGNHNHNHGGNYGYGHTVTPPFMGTMNGGIGNLNGKLPQTPADLYKEQKKGSGIIGTIVETAATMAVMKEMNEMQKEAEERRKQAEEEAEAKAAAVKEDYSMAEGYPAFCPGCGAPTTGARFCEYCDVKVY